MGATVVEEGRIDVATSSLTHGRTGHRSRERRRGGEAAVSVIAGGVYVSVWR
jgi:hypothetical protein